MTPYSQPRLYSVAWRAACRRSARDELAELDAALTALAREATPSNLSLLSIGVDHAGQLLITACDNPERLRSASAFARPCGVAPIRASSGRTQRHHLHRGGDRNTNRALHLAIVVRPVF